MNYEDAMDRVLEACESGDLVLQAIVDGKFGEMDESELDTLYAELHLMDMVAIKRTGAEHMVHWDASGNYQ